MPATNYSKTFEIESGGTVVIVFVDTTTIAPSMNRCCNEEGGISTSQQQERIYNQLGFIDSMLNEAAQTNPTWLLVAGHYPMFSKGDHGDTSELKTYLLPLLLQYNVHAYFCGHDHMSEHLEYGGINFFVNGGGSMTDSIKQTSEADLLWAGEGYSAFASGTATAENLTISFIDRYNILRYSYVLTNSNARIFSPSMSPSLISQKKIVDRSKLILSEFALISLVVMGGAIFFKKKFKNRKVPSLLTSYSSPDSTFNKGKLNRLRKTKKGFTPQSSRTHRQKKIAVRQRAQFDAADLAGFLDSVVEGDNSLSISDLAV
jgi:hypothetical protein